MIRPATAADIPAMMRVRRAVRENRLSNPGSIGPSDYAAHVRAACCWVWEAPAGILGFAALDLQHASVWALFVLPDAEGRGVGRALLARLVETARKHNLANLSLTTSAGSRADLFYRRRGWTTTAGGLSGDVRLSIKL